jgi:hypothetical protein
MTYWQSTRSPVHMFKKIYEGQEVAAHLTDNARIDSALLAVELSLPHLNRLAVMAYQRRLGVRAVIHTGRMPK